MWVIKNNPFKIIASDTNGYILKRWIDWDRNGVWDDSSTSTDTFYHAWDTTFGGKFATYDARVMDDDSILSSVKTYSVFVRMGRPVLWADKLDTAWVIVDKGYGNYYCHIHHFDTNESNIIARYKQFFNIKVKIIAHPLFSRLYT